MTTLEKINELKSKLNEMERQVLMLEQKAKLEDFLQHMSDTFDKYMGDNATNENCDIFYNLTFDITFNGKTISLENGAEMYSNIEYTIKQEIEDLS